MSQVLDFSFFLVYLPEGYNPAISSFSIVYALPGKRSTAADFFEKGNWKTALDTSIRQNLFPPCIVICLNTPIWRYSNPFESFFIHRFIPFIESNYCPNCSHRSILGTSMGGYGALYYSLRYPSLFQTVIAISPALIPPEISSLSLLTHWIRPTTNRFLIFCGKQDPFLRHVLPFVHTLRQHRLQVVSCVTPGGHGWSYYQVALRILCKQFGSFFLKLN